MTEEHRFSTSPPCVGDDRNRIKNRNSGTLPEFRFRLIRNRNDFSKFRFRLIRNRIGDLKFRFRSIRTGLRQIKSGKKDKQINRLACAYRAVVNNIRHVCMRYIWLFWMYACLYLLHMPEPRDMRWPNRIKNRKSGNQPEFRFRLIRNRIDLSKFRFRLIRNRIGKLKIRFRLIRTGIQFRKSGSGSGFLKPHSGRPLNTTRS